MQIQIACVSEAILDHLSAGGLLGEVHSAFDRAINIRLDGAARIIALTFSSAGKLPYALMVADGQLADFSRLGISAGQKVSRHGGEYLQIDTIDALFDYSLAHVWDSHMAALSDPADRQAFRELLGWSAGYVYQRANQIGLVPLLGNPQRLLAEPPVLADTPELRLARMAAPIVYRLLTALRHADREGLSAETNHLLGYGIGGTPSGDDLLVGLMAALQRSGQPGARRSLQLLSDTLDMQLTSDATTLLSLTVLEHALAAEYSEKIQEVTRLLMHPGDAASLQASLDRLLLHGATSGAEMFLGVCLGFMLIQDI